MFGEKLRSARINKKMKQSELADILQVRNTSISNWEKGISNPDIKLVDAICLALELPASYFFETSDSEDKYSLTEKEYIRKYRQLDNYGRKAVDSVLANEHARCNDDNHFINYEDALEFMHSRPRYAMGGINVEKMDKDKLMRWANDFWIMEQEAKDYID